MNNIQVFQNQNFGEIRVVNYNGAPWFVAKDVCDVLGIANPTDALNKGLEDYERARFNLGRQGEANIISESGFYTLVFRSRKPVAAPFRTWVATVVLPQIRKTGMYVSVDENGIPYNAEEFIAKALEVANKILQEREQQIKDGQRQLQQAHNQIMLMQPKVDYCNAVLNSQDLVPISQIAKDDYGISAVQLNKLLCSWGIQFKKGKRYFLYAKYDKLGYVGSRTSTWQHKDGSPGVSTDMLWTQCGRQFIYEQMKQRGYLTLTEQVMAKANDILNFVIAEPKKGEVYELPCAIS